jgi:hypothetical protein
MRTRLAILLPFLLVASGAIWWGAPQGAAQQPLGCFLHDPQPEHPLEMNTVVSDPRTSQFRDPLIKHVIMEKEIYDCDVNFRSFTRDVETFIEIIQRVQGGRTTTVEKRVEEIACDKGNRAGFGVECSARDVPLEEGLPGNIICSEPAQRVQPKDPVEMNTVITSRQDTVKTFKVDKELIDCREDLGGGVFSPASGDLYLFTEIVEARAVVAGVDNIRSTEKKFQAILCLIDRGRCFHFIPEPPPA